MILSEEAANAAAKAVTGMLDGGFLVICDSSGNELVRLQLGSPAFGEPVSGEAIAGPIPRERFAASGKAEGAFYRVLNAEGQEIYRDDAMLAADPERFGECIIEQFVYRQPTGERKE